MPLTATSGATSTQGGTTAARTEVRTISSRGTIIANLKAPTTKQAKRKPYTRKLKTILWTDRCKQTTILSSLAKTRVKTKDIPVYGSSECESGIQGGHGFPQSGTNPAHEFEEQSKSESPIKALNRPAKDDPETRTSLPDFNYIN